LISPKKGWNIIPSDGIIKKTVSALKKRGFTTFLVENKAEALEKAKELIPEEEEEVMTGSSTTLYQIGFMDYYLSGEPKWNCLGPIIFNEKDPEIQQTLRRKADTADYFIASVNALTEDGLLVACDRSGSRVSAYPFTAKRVILVVGAQKITQNLEQAMRRVREYVFLLEDERAKSAYGTGSNFGKWVIIENEFQKDRISIVLVKEVLGF